MSMTLDEARALIDLNILFPDLVQRGALAVARITVSAQDAA
jgi:hypothetical protein